MLSDELIQLSKVPLSNAFSGLSGFENLNMNDLTGAAGKSVINAVLQQMQNGDFNSLTEMFSGRNTDQNHEIVNGLKDPVSADLMNQFGISSQSAQQLAMLAIPILLNLFNQKVSNSQNNGFNINDLIRQFTSNQSNGGLMQIISNLFRTRTNQSNSTHDLFNTIIRNFL